MSHFQNQWLPVLMFYLQGILWVFLWSSYIDWAVRPRSVGRHCKRDHVDLIDADEYERQTNPWVR